MSDVIRLRQKAAALRAKAEHFEKLADQVEAALAGEREAAKAEATKPFVVKPPPGRRKGKVLVLRRPGGKPDPNSQYRRIQRRAAEIIERRGMPVPLREIFEEMRGTDLEPKGKDPRSILSAYLSRAENLKSYPDKGWWLADKPLPKKHEGPDAGASDPSE